jgi:hypothetical protein
MCTTYMYTNGTRVRTYVRTYVHVYKKITLAQKGLEIQALRCDGETSGRCQQRRHHGTRVYYGSNSTAMSAARISTTILASMWACKRTRMYHGTRIWPYHGTIHLVVLQHVPWYVLARVHYHGRYTCTYVRYVTSTYTYTCTMVL